MSLYRFEVDAQYGAFYTGGVVAWTSNGDELLCQDTGKINVLSIETGNIVKTIGGLEGIENDEIEEDLIYSFTLSDDDEFILTAHKSGLLKLWSKKEGNNQDFVLYQHFPEYSQLFN